MKLTQNAGPVERFVPTLVARDFDALQALFDDGIKFRALVPPALREGVGPAQTIEHWQRWFGDADAIEILASQVEHVGDRISLRYRLRVHEDGTWYQVAQSLICDLSDDKIQIMDMLCSGMLPETV